MPKGMKTGPRLGQGSEELSLTARQKKVAELLLLGYSVKKMAEELETSMSSVRGTVEALINNFRCEGLDDLKPKLQGFLDEQKKDKKHAETEEPDHATKFDPFRASRALDDWLFRDHPELDRRNQPVGRPRRPRE